MEIDSSAQRKVYTTANLLAVMTIIYTLDEGIVLTSDVNSRHEYPLRCDPGCIELPFTCGRGKIAHPRLPPLPVVKDLYVLSDLPDSLLSG